MNEDEDEDEICADIPDPLKLNFGATMRFNFA